MVRGPLSARKSEKAFENSMAFFLESREMCRAHRQQKASTSNALASVGNDTNQRLSCQPCLQAFEHAC